MVQDTTNSQYSPEEIKEMQEFLLAHKDKVEESVTLDAFLSLGCTTLDWIKHGAQCCLRYDIIEKYAILHNIGQLPPEIPDYGST